MLSGFSIIIVVIQITAIALAALLRERFAGVRERFAGVRLGFRFSTSRIQ